MMKVSLITCLCLAGVFCANHAFADETIPSTATATPVATITSTPATPETKSFSPDQLKGHWAVGVSSMSGIGTALALRYWYEGNEALDLLVGGTDAPLNGTTFTNTYVSTPNWSYGLSLGMRHILGKPAEDVFTQWLVRVNYTQTYQQQSNTSFLTTSQTQDLTLFTGPGFEAFVPFWKNLSIEGNIGLSLDSHWIQTDSLSNSTYSSNIHSGSWVWSLGLSNTITSIVNASVHFYF